MQLENRAKISGQVPNSHSTTRCGIQPRKKKWFRHFKALVSRVHLGAKWYWKDVPLRWRSLVLLVDVNCGLTCPKNIPNKPTPSHFTNSSPHLSIAVNGINCLFMEAVSSDIHSTTSTQWPKPMWAAISRFIVTMLTHSSQHSAHRRQVLLPTISQCLRCHRPWQRVISPNGTSRKVRYYWFRIRQSWRTRFWRASGDAFSAGDVLLEVETDKAQMDVEAQDDGVMAKIIVRTLFIHPLLSILTVS